MKEINLTDLLTEDQIQEITAEFANVQKKPGVGVMMWDVSEKKPVLVLHHIESIRYTVVIDGCLRAWAMFSNDRIATPEEITAFFHPGESAYVDNADEVGDKLFPAIEKAIGGDRD